MTYEHEQTGPGMADAADEFIRQHQREKAEDETLFPEVKTQMSMGYLANYIFRRRGSVENSVDFARNHFPRWQQKHPQELRAGDDGMLEMQARACQSLTWTDLMGYASKMFVYFTEEAKSQPVGSPRRINDGKVADDWSRALEVVTKASQPAER
jgi:hypothetical protein